MRFGMCADLLDASLVAAAGFDYIEGSMAAVADAQDDAYARMKQAVAQSGLRVESMNLMMTGKFRLTGPAADLAPVKEYLTRAFGRAGELGVKAVSFGASGARNLPEGWPMEKGLDQLEDFLRLAAPIAAENGVAIGVEALNPGECNLITRVSEAAALARRMSLPNVGVLADWYHMALAGESAEVLPETGGLLLHCHIANPAGRRYPLPGDGADYSGFFGALKRMGYAGRMSVEGNGAPAEYAAALARLRECAQ